MDTSEYISAEKISLLCDRIIEAEDREGLFDIRVNGIGIYQHLRMYLYYETTSLLGIFQPKNVAGTSGRLGKFTSYAKHAICHNDLFGVRPATVAIVEHTRKAFVDGDYRDIYTDILLDHLPYEFCVVKKPWRDMYFPQHKTRKNVIYYDYFMIKRKIMMKLGRDHFDGAEAAAQRIDMAFKKYVHSRLDLYGITFNKIIMICLDLMIAEQFLERLRPSLLILVNSYGNNTTFVNASKRLKIPTVELQHGIINSNHMGYHFPNGSVDGIDAFPDYFFSFGEYWRTAASFPIPKDKVMSVGFPFGESQRKIWLDQNKNKKQVLFLSQRVIGDGLSKIALDTAKKLPDYMVVYKLHPKQYYSWREEMPCLARNSLPNVRVLGGNAIPLYQLFAESSWQVGVFSTALFEGLWFGLRTTICKLPGWENVKGMVEAGLFKLASNVDEVVSTVLSDGETRLDVSQIFRPNGLENMLWGIDSIIRTKKPGRFGQ
jgi:hypothetical protein